MKVKSLIFCGTLTYLFWTFFSTSTYPITVHDFRVNSDSAEGIAQFGAGISFDKNGNFTIVWSDRGVDHNNRQIYFQRFDSLANRIGDPVLASDSTIHKNNEFDIAMHPSGSFVICWITKTYVEESFRDVWVQGFDSLGEPAWPRQQVDVDRPQNSLVEWMPSIAMDKDGNFIVVWATQDSVPDYHRNIYAQRFSSSGERIGNNFPVSDSIEVTTFPDVAFNSEGYCLICWQGCGIPCEKPWPNCAVSARIYNPAGEPITSIVHLVDPCSSKWGSGAIPAVASNSQNNFVIAANAFDTLHTYPNNTVIVQTFDTLGNPVDTAKVASDVIDMGSIFFRPRIAVDSADGYVVLWADSRTEGTDYNLWAQRFNSSGEPQGQNYRINIPPGVLDGNWFMYDLAIHKNTVGFAWVDLRNEDTYYADIYAKLLDLDVIGYYLPGDVVLDGKIDLTDVIYIAIICSRVAGEFSLCGLRM